MNSVILAIVEKFGGMAKLKEAGSLKIQNKPYMDLNIDYLGQKWGGESIAVAHNYVQNGDVMADPDMECIVKDGKLYPVTYQLDGLGIYQQAMKSDGNGGFLHSPSLMKQLKSFMNGWERNIKQQGFLDEGVLANA